MTNMERTTRRAAFVLIAAVIMTLTWMWGIGSASAAYAATSGDCGTTAGTVSFVIDGDGVMTVSGTGSIKQQTKQNAYAWYADRTKVKKLVLEEGVTNAPNSAFYGMTNLKDVQLPSTLDTWGTSVFASSNNIETIEVAEGGEFSAKGNILYGENETRLIMSGKAVSGKVELPQTLTTIDANGLDGRGEITEIVMPEGLKTIGNNAFRNVKKPETLTIPSTVTSIGTNAFQNWENITEAAIPEGVTALSNNTFSGCANLQKVTLPEGLQTMGTYVFQNCKKLKELQIPSSVTKIDGNAFNGCESLEALTLPEGLTTLGTSAFNGCSALKQMTIPAGITALGTATNSSMFLNCKSLEKVVLPDGLKTIGASSFKGCAALKTVDIPDSVTAIGPLAFQQCAALVRRPGAVAVHMGELALYHV